VKVKAGFLLDVNVLIATAWPTHRAHASVQRWLSRRAREGWATCPLTQTAIVRILSNPAFSPNALTPGDAGLF
jgi:predicted nucleic acid-binding protein